MARAVYDVGFEVVWYDCPECGEQCVRIGNWSAAYGHWRTGDARACLRKAMADFASISDGSASEHSRYGTLVGTTATAALQRRVEHRNRIRDPWQVRRASHYA